ncbi:hypothetical protein BSR28_03225 [Boudabousia liubingyangii]|uniref:class I SAM-dependent methyltransferase n=1 Tax=Boudabousia liubingyangii TaxID=1921764 RepID=UPI00093946C6|nr:methyltransferase [Boudabousia liubingyangii]OKL47523.1 hypothetical protein BSR28_03225 [Boudabousia liubingyangii]
MSQHYFTSVPAATESELTQKEFQIRGRQYTVNLADQVFSHQKLDLATSVLLDFVPTATGPALDLGCGWGPITLGLCADISQAEDAPQVREPGCDPKGELPWVLGVDVNERALDLTNRNLQQAGFSQALPEENGSQPADGTYARPLGKALLAPEALALLKHHNWQFQTIWSNPPIRIGKDALHELLLTWLPFLAPQGAAYLVVGNNLGAGSLMKWLIEQGYPTEKVKSKKGFAILRVQKPPQ